MTVALAKNNLRRHVLGDAAETEGLLFGTVHDLGQPEVSQFEVSPVVQQDVLGLQVPVDYAPAVQVLHREQNLSCVELGCLLVEPPHLPEQIEEFPLSKRMSTPANRSTIRNSLDLVWKAKCSFTMNGWSIAYRMYLSDIAICMSLFVFISFLLMILRA